MSLKTLNDLLIHELQDLCSAESQLSQAMPKMQKAATSPELIEALESHLAETLLHLEKIEAILEDLQSGPAKIKCVAMAGIIKEATDLMAEVSDPAIKDAALIASAQRVEHYECAAYESTIAIARALALDDVVAQLEQILDEEEAASAAIAVISESINSAALEVTDA